MRASFIKGRNTPWGSTQTPVGKCEMVPVPPLSAQVLVRDGVGDQVFQRLEVGLAGAPLAVLVVCTPPATAPLLGQDMGPQAIVADAGDGFHGSRRGPGLGLGGSHLREHGVALLGVRPPAGRHRRPGRTRPRPTGPECPHRAGRPGMPRPSTPQGRVPPRASKPASIHS